MDINSTPAAALILKQGGTQQKFNLATLKHDAQVTAQVAGLASQGAPASPTDPNRGQAVNTTA